MQADFSSQHKIPTESTSTVLVSVRITHSVTVAHATISSSQSYHQRKSPWTTTCQFHFHFIPPPLPPASLPTVVSTHLVTNLVTGDRCRQRQRPLSLSSFSSLALPEPGFSHQELRRGGGRIPRREITKVQWCSGLYDKFDPLCIDLEGVPVSLCLCVGDYHGSLTVCCYCTHSVVSSSRPACSGRGRGRSGPVQLLHE
jgi:hypothetical protein